MGLVGTVDLEGLVDQADHAVHVDRVSADEGTNPSFHIQPSTILID